MTEAYSELRRRLREAATLSAAGELLGWDQETMMPPRAAEFRAEELSLLSRLVHQRVTDPRIGELIEACERDPALAGDAVIAANLREIRRDHERAVRLPEDLVAEISETSSRAMEAWKRARAASDFAMFRPWLDKQVVLNRRKAECWGHPEDGELFDALLEDFEPGMTSREVERIFGPLRDDLRPLIAEVAQRGQALDRGPLDIAIPIEDQRAFHAAVLARLGFDGEAGRLDVSAHPFSTGLGPGDTRITTRYRETMFVDGLGSTIHEAGHAMYEQGLPKQAHFGEPLAEPLGLGIHESQSRLWENHVGRSRPFWCWALGEMRDRFGAPFRDRSVDELFRAVNIVEPNLIRIESDEATYNLHIMLRFDLERAMIRGDLAPADLPGAWNERIRADLGLEVPDDARGCLQDVHWSMGAIGYFPSYTLGSLYAAQFWEALSRDVEDVDGRMAQGEFTPVLDWLRREIHAHGRCWPAAELCRRITGRPLDHAALMRHLRAKLSAVYAL